MRLPVRLPAILSVLYAPLCFAAAGAAGPIEFKTDNFVYRFGEDAVGISLIDPTDGTNYLSEARESIADIVVDGKRHAAATVRREGDRLRLAFVDTDATVTLKTRTERKWIVFEVESVSGSGNIDELTFLNVRITAPPGPRKFGGHARSLRMERFAVTVQTLDLQTNANLGTENGDYRLIGRCYSKFGLEGARAALLAVPVDDFIPAIEALEIAEDLPHSTLDGELARISRDGRTGYLFIDLVEANADETIAIAKELGFRYIMTYVNRWSRTKGSYEINTEHFPNGMASLKAVADKVHAAGLKIGLHCLTGFVQKSDPLVRPVPDPRLAKDEQVTLAADIDAAERFIPSVEPPEGFPDDIAFGLRKQGFTVQIDDELIDYRGVSMKPPYGLEKCVRGAHGTQAAPHRKGAPVYHLTQRFNSFLVDCDTDLADRVAARYAEVINECGIDMIYFDGAGSNIAFGREWMWRYVPYIPLLSERLWKREVRVGGSCSGPLYWHMRDFVTCNDFTYIANKRFFDYNKAPTGMTAELSMIPIDFGWWGLHTWSPHNRSTTPDEIEYICQKALAFDAFWSLETTLDKVNRCGRWEDIKKIIATYERLRLGNYFDESVKAPVRETEAEFKLIGSDEAGWRLVPARYGPAHLALDHDSRSWVLDNDLPAQPLRFRLYALPVLEDYGSADNPTLFDQSEPSLYKKPRTEQDCETALSGSGERTPDDEASVEFIGRSGRSDDGGWVEQRLDLIDVSGLDAGSALIEGEPDNIATGLRWARGLAVWVHGDGKGEVLNIQLRARNGGYRDHYVDVNFKGWKRCAIPMPESDRVFERKAGYSRKHAARHFDYGRLMTLYLRYNMIPANTEVRCLVGPVKALRETWLPVKNPTMEVNGTKIAFPCELETEQYLEFDGEGEARRFDRNGVEQERVKPKGTVPVVKEGANRIAFTADAGEKTSSRADITVIRFGE